MSPRYPSTVSAVARGPGRDLSRYGFDDYTRVKHVLVAHTAP
ncbi:hypothetical protein [Streptomyces sp. NPDC056669]